MLILVKCEMQFSAVFSHTRDSICSMLLVWRSRFRLKSISTFACLLVLLLLLLLQLQLFECRERVLFSNQKMFTIILNTTTTTMTKNK